MAETTVKSPIGRIYVEAGPAGVTRMEIAKGHRGTAAHRKSASPAARQARGHVTRAIRQLKEYFAGRRQEFDLPLDLRGTPHQQAVWHGLLDIPYGETLAYGELARRVGTPKAARAVGAACGANPVWLVVPCHRAVGSNGSLTGYGGGLWRKEYLLKHEGALQENRNSVNENRKSDRLKQRAFKFAAGSAA
ncbi:MAG: methylated-DNA--[protein]-cysteine S-methyltransferase [Candidatus Acidiferrales bacterium]